jgi:hypothetical protein
MNITDAINAFAGIHPKFAISETPRILRIVEDLSLSDTTFTFSDDRKYIFDLNWREYTDFTAAELKALKSAPCFNYERDHQGTIRIHPTMVLAKKCFAGSTDRGWRTNPIHRHHLPLVYWTDKRPGNLTTPRGVRKVMCKECFVWVPVGSECLCGKRHTD